MVTLLARLCGTRESLPVFLAAEDGWSDMVFKEVVCGVYSRKGLWLIPGVRRGKYEQVTAQHVRKKARLCWAEWDDNKHQYSKTDMPAQKDEVRSG